MFIFPKVCNDQNSVNSCVFWNYVCDHIHWSKYFFLFLTGLCKLVISKSALSTKLLKCELCPSIRSISKEFSIFESNSRKCVHTKSFSTVSNACLQWSATIAIAIAIAIESSSLHAKSVNVSTKRICSEQIGAFIASTCSC